MQENATNIFNPMEIDAIGEILNISLGSSATAISNMVDRRVNITTPTVEVVSLEDFEYKNLEPAVGVEITYTKGLEGSNIMLLKRQDVKAIVELLMSMEIPDEEFELDEMNMSAVCEVMNQMMGAASTALAEFLGETVDISTPVSFEITDEAEFKAKYFSAEDPMVVVRFDLSIEDKLESEFLNVMAPRLAKRIISNFGLSGEGDEVSPAFPETTPEPATATEADGQEDSGSKILSEDEIAALLSGASEPEPQPEPAPVMESPAAQPDPIPQPVAQAPQQVVQAPPVAAAPRIIESMPPVSAAPQYISTTELGAEQASNLDLLMGVPLQLSVEIGRTKRPLKEILEFGSESLVVLDKLAGDTVDLFVNGQCIARGDVVVVDDYFGVRITEIVKKPDFLLK